MLLYKKNAKIATVLNRYCAGLKVLKFESYNKNKVEE